MGPLLLHYYVTYRCNGRCVFCDIPPSRAGSKEPTLAEIEENLRSAKRLGVKFVDFTGGEPLLFRDLPEALRCAKALGLWTSVTTNCLLYPSRGKELAALVDLLHFSLDSMDREEHDRIRGVPCYDAVMESVDLAQRMGERPDILFTVTSNNIGRLPEMVSFAQAQKLILIVNPVFSYFGNSGLSADQVAHLRRFRRAPYVYLNRAFLQLLEQGGNDTQDPRCRAVDAALVISPDDHLLLPCYHHQIERLKVAGKLEQLLRSEARARARSMQGRYDFCQGCTINCYFDPSFLYKVDGYFLNSLFSKGKYGMDKYMRRRHLPQRPLPTSST